MVTAAERETKFLVTIGQVPFLARLLDQLCQPDPRYPTGELETLYFDTARLSCRAEKENSDYHKRKVRVRWYGPPSIPFVEIKERIGSLRRKVRHPCPEAAGWQQLPLTDPRLAALPRQLGVPLPPDLLPALSLGYRRQRYLEPASGARISLDTGICLCRVHPGRFAHPDHRPLPVAVLEVKGTLRTLPPRLLRLGSGCGLRRVSFSKYYEVFQRLRPTP